MTTRTAFVHSYTTPTYDDLQRVSAYLPDNYTATNASDGVKITGEDVAGWTLDDYVIPRLASGLIFAHEVFKCSTCGSDTHNVGACPDEVLVYAVKVNGEDLMYVADDDEGLKLVVGTHASYGQCQNCGSFAGEDAANAGEPVAFTLTRIPLTTANGAQVFAVCDGCGTSYPIRLVRTKEVCF